MWLKKLLLGGMLCFPLCSMAAGMASSLHPEIFCPLGAKIGMPTGTFDKVDFSGCSSRPKAVTRNPGRNRLSNTLAFYSLSQPSLEYLSVMLNVNNPEEAREAYAALLPAATTLTTEVLGQVPKGLEQAVMAGQSKRWQFSGWLVELKRKEWAPASEGHQLTLRLHPAS